MRVLFDTSAFLIAHSDPDRLGPHLEVVSRPDTERLVPAVVPWEITIKYDLGKLELPTPPQQWFPAMMAAGAMRPVPIEPDHVLALGDLPPVHRDPFDRLIITMARALDVPVLTSDRVFTDYPVEVLLLS
ncbi:PIN domain nuclease of toxin-antitoxin system [Knoellia remsis]|uniref:PIN domain nuclease of toxin-antitoxin system n=1 Tax=Knoellia remsis TaxID=407159 RepID=A0A2T0UQZ6_9MICO|nr:type II toxin-antitoxin system VapC family toxin [Knoellia remsis]PRY60333.1 PIN domain nuclease of toxin-antitoxin system [Knoellia remsis]